MPAKDLGAALDTVLDMLARTGEEGEALDPDKAMPTRATHYSRVRLKPGEIVYA